MTLNIKKNVELAPYTTYKIGGPAKYFVEARSDEEIAEAVSWARKQSMPFFILGGGSNILVSDKGFDGLAIKTKNLKLKIKNFSVECEAGVDLPRLVQETIDRGMQGLEWASGIPGTFGGAVRGNAGAFGGEIKDVLTSVKFLDEAGEVRVFKNSDCNFSYRDSIFKQADLDSYNPKYVILSAKLNLALGSKKELKKFSQNTIAYRAARHPLEYGSCGSVFQAIPVNDIKLKNFIRYPRLREVIKDDPFPVIPAACFIDEAELKGRQIGGAMISTKHPNFLVNCKNASAEDVVQLVSFTKQRLLNQFGVFCEEEVQYVGW